jgi:SAM-dependent methyltransferase
MTVELKRALASVWTDAEAARLYRYRAPYPPRTFEILRGLAIGPRTVLDAGAGTGALARHMTAFATRVDAVDPSAAMIREGRALPGGADSRIRWIHGSAEQAALDPPYGLITTGKSLHWMDHQIVMARFHDALAPGGFLAIVDHDEEYPALWNEDLVRVIKAYSPTERPYSSDTIGDLVREGLFERHGFQRTSAVPFEQSVEEFTLALGSTSSLSRVTLGARQDAFAAEVRALFARLGLSRVAFPVAGNVVWGRPLRR